MYLTENEVDLSYLFLYAALVLLLALFIPEEKKKLKQGVTYHVDFCFSLLTIPVNPT